MPRGIHQWAQADRYAIAARYTEDRVFWKPATYSIISEDGEVGVEFPLIQFISGKIARYSNSLQSLPFIYRLLSFVILFLGFYRLLNKQLAQQRWWVRYLTAVFLFSSPVLLFYGHNFSPDALSLAFILLGMSYLRKIDEQVNWPLIACLGLAAAIKTSAGIYLIGYAAYALWTQRKVLNTALLKSLGLITAVLVITGLYAKFLIIARNQALWSTLFLAQTNQISSIGDILDLLKALWRWKYEYLNGLQWSFALLVFLFVIIKKRLNLKGDFKILYLLWFAGILAILWLFGKQFVNHDYYALATFLPPAYSTLFKIDESHKLEQLDCRNSTGLK